MMADFFKSAEVLVLDGGMSNELNKHVTFEVQNEPLWTAKALVVAPKAVVDTHLAYLEGESSEDGQLLLNLQHKISSAQFSAGADIIATCTYQATVEGFRKHLNLSTQQGEMLIKEAVVLARNAVEEFSKSGNLKF